MCFIAINNLPEALFILYNLSDSKTSFAFWEFLLEYSTSVLESSRTSRGAKLISILGHTKLMNILTCCGTKY